MSSTLTEPVRIEVPRPYSLELCVRSHGWYQCPPFRWDGRTLLRGERDGARDCLIAIGQPAKNRLEVSVTGAGDVATRDRMVTAMGRMLRVDEDLSGFQRAAEAKPQIADHVGRGWGRILRGGSLWEDVTKALMGTNVAWRQAVRMIDGLARLGPSSSHAVDLPLFPTPEEVLAAGEETIREQVRCGYRAPYLLGIAAGVRDGTFDLDDLDQQAAALPTAEVERRLRELPGIGPATAAYLLTFLGHYDRPTVDSSTVAYAAERYFDGEKRSLKETTALFDHYAPYRALGIWAEFWVHWQGEKEERDGQR